MPNALKLLLVLIVNIHTICTQANDDVCSLSGQLKQMALLNYIELL